jgi:hypothetical protein
MLNNDVSLAELEQSYSTLDTRVQRLEDAVAAMQDTHLMEERILERLHERPQVKSGPAPLEDHVTANTPHTSQTPPPVAMSALTEWRAIVRMFFDVHYHIAWTTRFLAIVLVAVIVTSQWWFPLVHVPIMGPIFDKTLDILVAFVLYRVLATEARRYVSYRG